MMSKPVGVQGLSLYAFDDAGRIRREQIYFDVVSVLAQLGVATKEFESGAASMPALAATPVVTVATGAASEDANVAAAIASEKGLEQRDSSIFLAPYSDDVEHLTAGRGQPTKGKAEEKKLFERITKAMQKVEVSVDAWGAGPFVVEGGSISGVNDAPLGAYAPAKKRIAWHSAAIVEFSNSKIVRKWSYANRAELLTQLGVKYAR